MSTREGKRLEMSGRIFLLGLLFVLIPVLSSAQQFPTKPVNLLIGFAPGGGIDLSIRAVAYGTEKYLGYPFIITNRGGGGGSTGLGINAKESPDGYHLFGGATDGLLYVPHYREVTYTYEDFVPILCFAKGAHVGLMVKADSPWKTLKDLVEHARKNPGAVTYGSSGAGMAMHIVMEYIGLKEGIKWTHVPYKGSSESFKDMLGGHVTAASLGVHQLIDHVKAGRTRVLAIWGGTRMKTLPDIPTVKELGYDFVAESPFFIASPKGTPQPIVKKLEETFHKGMEDPKFRETMAKMEMEIAFMSSEDTRKYFEENYHRIGKVFKELKITKVKE
jgi:tripartite-type tricarboxylate transporter receptor subunit TctC